MVQLSSRQLKKHLLLPRQSDLISPRRVAELEVSMIPRIFNFEVLMKGYIFLKLHNEALDGQVESITESKVALYRFRFRSKT